PGVSRGTREAPSRPAGSPDSRRRVGVLLRGGRRDLRLRRRNDQEPGQPCPRPPRRHAVDREHGRFRPRPRYAGHPGGRLALIPAPAGPAGTHFTSIEKNIAQSTPPKSAPTAWRLEDGTLRHGRAPAAHEPEHRREDEENEGNEEDDLGGFDREAGDAAEAEHGRDQRDDEECDSP